MYVYNRFMMTRFGFNIILLLLLSMNGFSQGIRLDHKMNPDKFKAIRIDKPVMVKTFDGTRVKGMATILENEKLSLDGKEIHIENIMMISGYVERNSKEKAVGLGLTIGAGIIAPAALYYILGGIAWGIPNGIFIGATVLAFDLLLAYIGTNLMGIYPRRFSTMNWQVIISPGTTLNPIPIPIPSD